MKVVGLTGRYGINEKVISETGIVTMSIEFYPVSDVHEGVVINADWIISRYDTIVINHHYLPHSTFYGAVTY